MGQASFAILGPGASMDSSNPPLYGSIIGGSIGTAFGLVTGLDGWWK